MDTKGTVNNGVNTTAETLTGRQKRELNLQPMNSLDKQRRSEISRLGGLARQEQIRQRKTMKEQILSFLDSQVSRDIAEKYLGTDANGLAEEDLTYQGILGAKMWQEAVEKGNARAAEFIRDTSGQKIKDEIQINGEIITLSDRALLDNIASRYREND